MKVAELITYLQTLDPDMLVMRDDEDHGIEEILVGELEVAYVEEWWITERTCRLVRTLDTNRNKVLIID